MEQSFYNDIAEYFQVFVNFERFIYTSLRFTLLPFYRGNNWLASKVLYSHAALQAIFAYWDNRINA